MAIEFVAHPLDEVFIRPLVGRRCVGGGGLHGRGGKQIRLFSDSASHAGQPVPRAAAGKPAPFYFTGARKLIRDTLAANGIAAEIDRLVTRLLDG